MSTRFTTKIPMVESQALRVIQATAQLNRSIIDYVSAELIKKGYESISPSLLSFLSVLDCGVNYASEIARTLGVTRQMVGKTVKELNRLGYLEQLDGPGKQRKIVFTLRGEQLISAARQILFELDNILCDAGDSSQILDVLSQLKNIESKIQEHCQIKE